MQTVWGAVQHQVRLNDPLLSRPQTGNFKEFIGG